MVKRVREFGEIFGGEGGVWVCGEIWKIDEERVRGRVEEVIGELRESEGRGEIVIILGGKEK